MFSLSSIACPENGLIQLVFTTRKLPISPTKATSERLTCFNDIAMFESFASQIFAGHQGYSSVFAMHISSVYRTLAHTSEGRVISLVAEFLAFEDTASRCFDCRSSALLHICNALTSSSRSASTLTIFSIAS